VRRDRFDGAVQARPFGTKNGQVPRHGGRDDLGVAVRASARRYQDEPVAADAKLRGIAVDALLGQREWRARERAEAGDLWQAHALVFTTSVGTAFEVTSPTSPDTVLNDRITKPVQYAKAGFRCIC
jgi:hypothetical protein